MMYRPQIKILCLPVKSRDTWEVLEGRVLNNLNEKSIITIFLNRLIHFDCNIFISIFQHDLSTFETSVARKFRAKNTKGEPQNTKKNTTLKTKKHHVFGYKNTKYLMKSFKNGPPYLAFLLHFLKNLNFLNEIFQKI